MKRAIVWNHRAASVSVRSAGRLLAATALSCACLSAAAQDATRAPLPVVVTPDRSLAALEKAFWACDHAATVHGVVDAGTAIRCGAATEDLKLRKFNGDFNAMLSWWQRNKAPEHGALEGPQRAAGYR